MPPVRLYAMRGTHSVKAAAEAADIHPSAAVRIRRRKRRYKLPWKAEQPLGKVGKGVLRHPIVVAVALNNVVYREPTVILLIPCAVCGVVPDITRIEQLVVGLTAAVAALFRRGICRGARVIAEEEHRHVAQLFNHRLIPPGRQGVQPRGIDGECERQCAYAAPVLRFETRDAIVRDLYRVKLGDPGGVLTEKSA